MKALWLKDQQLSFRPDAVKPVPGPEEALVAVNLAGICGTDLQLLAGYYPYSGIPGHEFVGRITEAPDDPGRIGQRVVGEINIGCQDCPACLTGRSRHCKRRKVLGIKDHDGAFAEFLCLPLKNLTAVPEELSDGAAVFAEPLAAAMRIQDQVSVGPETRVLVIGAGRLGQLIARSLQPIGCELKVVMRRLYEGQVRLLERHGIDCFLEPDPDKGVFDLVIEASGDPSGWQIARRAVRPEGAVVLKSTYHDQVEMNLSSIVVDEISLIGSRCGSPGDALHSLAAGNLDPTEMIEARYPLEEGLRAFKHAARPGAMKVVLEIGDSC